MPKRTSYVCCKYVPAILAICGATWLTAAGQVVSLGRASIKGTVVMPDNSPATAAFKVTLKLLTGDQSNIYTDEQGRFEFPNLAAGNYSVEVDPGQNSRFDIATEKVTVQRNAPTFVTIYLKDKTEKSLAGSSVSVAMLDQKVPGAAKKEFEKATNLARQGKSSESIDALRRAIAIYPDYLMAHNDLGAQLLDLGRLDEALAELRIATRIDPNAYNAQLNLGIVLVRQKKFAEALAAVDKAMSFEPSSPAAHLYAGIASFELNDFPRAEKELRLAYELGSTAYAVALVHLGRLYLKIGNREKALDSFQTYLQVEPNGPNAAQVQKTIAVLHNP